MSLNKKYDIKKTHKLSLEYVSTDKCMDIAKLALSCLDKNTGNSELCKIHIDGVYLCKLEYKEINKKRNKEIVKIKY
jgi:hypothetical protein